MARARSLAEFQKSFLDEGSCAAFLIKRRWPDDFARLGCGNCRAVGLKSQPRLHECLDCGRRTSVTAMHRSKLPLTAWFWAAHLMTIRGPTRRHIRRSMLDPNRTPLEGVVEVDQAEIPFRAGDAFIGNVRKKNARHWQTAPQARQISRYAFRPPPPCRDHQQFSRVDRGLRESQREAGNHAANRWLLSGYRHDPRVVGTMAGHVLPWSHRE
jgi:hypothetical protein